LEDDSARGRYVTGNGVNSALAELTERARPPSARRERVPGSKQAARARLGDNFAEVLLLDQGTEAAKARTELG
jgi:hypothetical protein